MVNAVSRPATDSATTSVEPSGVMSMPFGKVDVVGDLADGPVGGDQGDEARFGELAGQEVGRVGTVDVDVAALLVDDDLVPVLPRHRTQVCVFDERPVRLLPHERLTRDEQSPVGQPVDRPAQALSPGRHHLAVPLEIGRDDLADTPVREPEPALVPTRGLHERQVVENDPTPVGCCLRRHHDPLHSSELDRIVLSNSTGPSSMILGMTSPAAAEAADEPRSTRKRRAILDAATAAFLDQGYRDTSMDAIAAAAGVSKQTVYQHFGDKQRLFHELIQATVQAASDPVYDEARQLADSGRLDDDLRDLARRLLALVMQPAMLRLRRVVIAEARRFPELGRAFYDQGPGRTIATLAETFAELAAAGTLNAPDPTLAATQFNWLIMSAPLNEAMLLGKDEPLTRREINKLADNAVRAFLAVYR